MMISPYRALTLLRETAAWGPRSGSRLPAGGLMLPSQTDCGPRRSFFLEMHSLPDTFFSYSNAFVKTAQHPLALTKSNLHPSRDDGSRGIRFRASRILPGVPGRGVRDERLELLSVISIQISSPVFHAQPGISKAWTCARYEARPDREDRQAGAVLYCGSARQRLIPTANERRCLRRPSKRVK